MISFLANPLLASLSDMGGRKPLLLLGAASSALKFLLVGMRPRVASLIASNCLVSATMYSWLLGTFASVGDVHGNFSPLPAPRFRRMRTP